MAHGHRLPPTPQRQAAIDKQNRTAQHKLDTWDGSEQVIAAAPLGSYGSPRSRNTSLRFQCR